MAIEAVIWDFGGEEISACLLEPVRRLRDEGLPDSLTELLRPVELDALRSRVTEVSTMTAFPVDPTGRRYPWPLV